MGLPPREERRHPGRTVAGSSSPLLSSLPPFFRQERCAYAGEIPRLWILSTNVKRSLALPVPHYPTPFHPLSSTKSTLRLPLECNEIWHVPFIPADIPLSFGHTFLAARSRVWDSFSLSLVYSSRPYKGAIYSDSNDNMNSRTTQSAVKERIEIIFPWTCKYPSRNYAPLRIFKARRILSEKSQKT